MDTPLERIASALAASISDATARATVVLLIAGIVAAVLGRSSASLRHAIWTVALAAAVAMPALLVLLPGWRIGIPLAARIREAASTPSSSFAIPEPEPEKDSPMAGAIRPHPSRPVSEAPISAPPPVPGRGITAGLALIGVWMAGATAALLPTLAARMRLTRIRRHGAIPAGSRVRDIAQHLQGALRVSGHVTLLLGKGGGSPMTWGILRPVILLPADS
ncbi:hypothetical protein OJF2_20890 [Aquisphaera giovannonii]|uniref:Uncharacterized protein n=1 Tax=Aquisphaera giovannonii TaxID=406548 RepID=A0A5B9W012_9BACT|nr:hypothetical protein [Aquisphaera giovannonii]QEH33587.1 hypothetical protein OJF2_20890 [Aquisphaera giovannonii]